MNSSSQDFVPGAIGVPPSSAAQQAGGGGKSRLGHIIEAGERDFAQLEAQIARKDAQLAEFMPTEQDCLRIMHAAWTRLQQLGWREAVYCPKDGSSFDVIEPGSTGIHRAHYEGHRPSGTWWIEDAGDLWPSRPILYRQAEEERQRWEALRAAIAPDDAEGDHTGPAPGAQKQSPTPPPTGTEGERMKKGDEGR